MMNKYLSSICVLFLFGSIAVAQVNLPLNAVPGKCYAECLKPAQFTTRTEQYVAKEAGKQLMATTAELGTTSDQMLTKEASKVYSATSATYKTETERILIKEAGKSVQVIPNSGTYRMVSERMETAPTYKRYEITGCNDATSTTATGSSSSKDVAAANSPCFTSTSERFMVKEGYNTLEVVPAQFTTETEKLLVKEASVRYEVNPAIYKTATEQFMTSPAYTQLQVDNNIQFKPVTERYMVRPSYVSYNVIPAKFKTVTERVMVREAAPATGGAKLPKYKTVTKRMLSKEASKRYEVIPAQYKAEIETVMVKESVKRLVVTPPVYQTITERVKIRNAYTKYEKGKVDPTCLSANPDDCRILCLVEVPAEYKTITKQVIKTPAGVKEIVTPAQSSAVTRQVVSTPASVREIDIPAQYVTITKEMFDGYNDNPNGTLSGANAFQSGAATAQYETVSKQVVVSEAEVKKPSFQLNFRQSRVN